MAPIRRGRWRGIACALAFLVAAPAGLAAQSVSPWAEIPETRARLLATTTGVGEAEVVTVGLEIELEPGWKTYWRSPGDAGTPPLLDWSGSENLAEAELRWPAPARFTAFGIETFGYTGEVVLPITVRLARSGEPLTLRLQLTYQVCKDICIPVAAELALSLPAGPASASPHAERVARFVAAVPQPSGAGSITVEGATVRTEDAGAALEVEVRSETPLSGPDLIVETAEPIYFGRPHVSLSDDRRQALIRLPIGNAGEAARLVGKELLLTLIDGASACEARIVAAGPG